MSSGKAIPFLIFENDGEDINIEINPEMFPFFSNIQEDLISPICIAGPQRTGKSFLANRILNQMKGFEIGPSTNACTKGIWIWNRPIKLSETSAMILLDTEGLGSLERNTAIDIKIFSLSILMSSVFIYNSLGHIDENAIESLSLVLNIAEHIQLSKGGKGEDISQIFPYFLWVLRDFSLDLKNQTPDEYLEESLQPVTSKDSEHKNEIRRNIKHYFKQRNCHCLVRPINDEGRLAHLEEENWENLRQEFRQGVTNFLYKVKAVLKPKFLSGKPLTGKMYLELIKDYVNLVNNGRIPAIKDLVSRVQESDLKHHLRKLNDKYDLMLKQITENNKLPLNETDLIAKLIFVFKVIQKDAEELSKKRENPEILVKSYYECFEKFERSFKEFFDQNNRMSTHQSKNILNKFMLAFVVPNVSSVEELNQTFFNQISDKYQQFSTYYENNSAGIQKYKLHVETIPKFLIEYFEKLLKMIINLYEEEIQKNKLYLQDAREGEQMLRSVMARQSEVITENENDIKSLKTQLQSAQVESEIVSESLSIDQKQYFAKIKMLEDKLKRKKNKIKNLKENAYTDKSTQDQDITGKREEEEGYMAEVNSINEKLAKITALDVDELQWDEENAKENFELLLGKIKMIKGEYKDIIDGIKLKIESDVKTLQKKVDFLTSENGKLKTKVMDLSECEKIVAEKDELIEKLKEEINFLKISGGGQGKNSAIDFEVELYKANSYNNVIRAEKEQLFDVMREGFKGMLKKTNTFTDKLSDLNPKDQQYVKKIVEELKLKNLKTK